MKKCIFILLLSGISFSWFYAFPQQKIDFRGGTYSLSENKNINKLYYESAIYDTNYYLILRFSEIPSGRLLLQLKENKIQLLSYLCNNSYYASVPVRKITGLKEIPEIISVDLIPSNSRIDPSLTASIPAYCIRKVNYADVALLYFHGINVQHITSDLKKDSIEILYSVAPLDNLVIRVRVDKLVEMSKKPWLMWMQPAFMPLGIENLPGRTDHRSNMLAASFSGARNLTGRDVKIGEWDEGRISPHIDLSARLTIKETAQPVSTHSTHVAGTVAGAGIINPFAKGMASEAQMFSWDYWGWTPLEMDSSYRYDYITITQNSYVYNTSYDTCKNRGYYDIISNLLDADVNNHADLVHVFSAGNSQSQCGLGGYRSISSGYQAAKKYHRCRGRRCQRPDE